MLENKRVNMILSLLIAIALWAFVIGEVNPEASRVYRDIPIHLIHESVLDESGLAVLSSSDASLTVTVTGTRSEVNQIREKDIVATVDLDQAAIGENQLRVDVKVPSKVEVEAQSINKVTVIVEQKIAKDVPVKVRYNGNFNGEEEPITISQSMETVTVTGAETNIGRVDHVDAVAEEGIVTEEESTFDCRLIPVDVNTSRVYNVELSQSAIEVTAELAKTKTVPLYVPILEDENLQLQRIITIPETITVKGRNTDLETIESVTAQALDVNAVTENTELTIIPVLPEGVEVSTETEPLVARIQVTMSISRTLSVSKADITLENLSDQYTAEILTTGIQITVVGNQDVISSLTKDNFVLKADLDGLKKGSHNVALSISCDVEGVEIQYNPQTIKVKLQPANGGTQSGGNNDNQSGDHNGDNDTDNSENNDNQNDNQDNMEE